MAVRSPHFYGESECRIFRERERESTRNGWNEFTQKWRYRRIEKKNRSRLWPEKQRKRNNNAQRALKCSEILRKIAATKKSQQVKVDSCLRLAHLNPADIFSNGKYKRNMRRAHTRKEFKFERKKKWEVRQVLSERELWVQHIAAARYKYIVISS